jgi:trehalose/maltose hydrolase-like predicted phosphorylase
MIRLHLYHSLVSISPHTANLDAGIPARGLTGEAYRGHIFWDELYVMPFFDFQFPETARSVLSYRYHRLGAARDAARQNGYRGAQFPWQSGSSGGEESQSLHLNPISGKWGPDLSHLQRHVSLAIAFNLWNYYWITSDVEFLNQYGAELLLSICQYWAARSVLNPDTGRYHISEVMGPDEFHESTPGSSDPGLTDNTYTNLMVVWVLNQAFNVLSLISSEDKNRIFDILEITDDDLDAWREISELINLSISEEGILEQFQGYFNLKELDWEHYHKIYRDIHRMDRILKSEGLSPNDYKVAKQADALMLFYNLTEETIINLLKQLGYPPPPDLLNANLHYYLQRTSHGSTLSRLVHGYLAHIAGNRELSWKLYQESLRSDFMDIQGGTTREGIHLGVMTGTVLFALRTYAGLDWTGDQLSLYPALPGGWKEMEFNLNFRGDRYYFRISNRQSRIKVEGKKSKNITIQDRKVSLKPGVWKEIDLDN